MRSVFISPDSFLRRAIPHDKALRLHVREYAYSVRGWDTEPEYRVAPTALPQSVVTLAVAIINGPERAARYVWMGPGS